MKKRRKTEGDTTTPSSSFHTQTLTQLPSWKKESPENWIIQDSDDEGEDEDAELKAFFGRGNTPKRDEQEENQDRTPSVIPQTPMNKRIRFEIPESNTTPLTPMLERYSPNPRNSPLKEKSANAIAGPKRMPGSGKRPRSLVIQDSFATAESVMSTPDKVSPEKSQLIVSETVDLADANFVLDDENNEEDEVQESPMPKKRPLTVRLEIPDSDDESGYSEDDRAREEDKGETTMIEAEVGADIQEDEERAFVVGLETQALMNHLAASAEAQSSSTESSAQTQPGRILSSTLPEHAGNVPLYSVGDARQSSQSAPDTTQTQTQSQIEAESLPKSSRITRRKAKPQACIQGFESQRIPLDEIRAMAPQTNRSDIFISIHPPHVANIIAGVKNHEFRNYKIPQTVARIWIYTTRPDSELKYMASISPAKQPGEIDDSDGGLRNAEFNDGRSGKFAYELLQVYELNNPVSLEGMKENGWVDGPPQKYVYVPPAVVGELMANLKYALFQDRKGGNMAEPGVIDVSMPDSSPAGTISQELAAQLHSDITHSTQFSPSERGVNAPSSQEISRTVKVATPRDEVFRRPMLPSKRTNTQLQPQPMPGRGMYRPSQATTASQASTPSESPEKSLQRPRRPSSSLPMFVDDDGSPVRVPTGVVIGSSPLLTKSQMLPDSLFRDEVRRPPEVWDSEADDDEL
jgi:predicted transcriptional regulator